MTGQYFSRYERALRMNPKSAENGRLEASVSFEIEDIFSSDVRKLSPIFQLMGPGDVERLSPGAIVRRYPALGSSDAECPKLAHVEFAECDLPWRYTPEAPSDKQLRPWLVLVVGVRGTDGISPRPDGTVRLGISAQEKHNLSDSCKWAHVHRVGENKRSRILSPLRLADNTSYVAVVVPAFTADGKPAWTGAGPVILPCYDRWEFRTGPKGDFPSLARQLRKADLADLELRGGRPFGRAELTYRPRTGGPAVALSAAGALRVPADSSPDPADGPPPAHVADDVAALQTPIISPDGRAVITAPDYPRAFRPVEAPDVAAGWPAQLTEDPRLRGAAGLGAWTAIAWQNRIADGAALKLGDTTLAAERIRALALGVAASRSLWRRRVPKDPVHALAVLAPALGRLPAEGVAGRTVLEALAVRQSYVSGEGPTSPQLAAALFSSAGHRALRPGPARSALAADGTAGLVPLLVAAASCPDPTDPPDVFDKRHPDPVADALAAAKEAIHAATDDPEMAARVADRLLGEGNVDAAWLAAVLTAMRPGPDGRVQEDELDRVLNTGEHPLLPEPDWSWDENPDEFAPECSPVDLSRLGEAVCAAIDPTVPEPPAAKRVYAMLPGITSMRPLEVEPELDIPLWRFLSTEAPDWMLPGVGDLAEHEVIGVETNPLFVQALLVGANHQAAQELRWRNVPLRPRSSPLRRFWQRAPGPSSEGKADEVYDIRPIRFWADETALGDAALTPTDRASEAVVVFKSPIFRRYSTTIVYLYDARPSETAGPDWDHPPETTVPLVESRRVQSTFTGSIGPDVTFFGFPVSAAALDHYWVVLEEPPAGYRFNADPAADVEEDEKHSGDYAHRRFALPVRVLIGPLS